MCQTGGYPSLIPFHTVLSPHLCSDAALGPAPPPIQHTSIPVCQPAPLETRQTDSQKLLANLSECKQTEELMK